MNTNNRKIIMRLMRLSMIMRLVIGITIMDFILLPSSALSQNSREYLEDKIDSYAVPVEEFLSREEKQKTIIEKKNQIIEIVFHSYQANVDSAYEILEAKFQRSRNAEIINWTMEQDQNRTKQNATNRSEFKYIKYSDGKIVRFTAGLPSSIENERVVDEFGNVSIRNTQSMTYNNKRLLTGYEATLRDNLGNTTSISCYGIKYSPDSVFYGGYETNANKNEMEKYIKETDSAGNVRLTHWQALSYEGKLLRAFSQTIEDSVYGNNSFTRTNITYKNNNHERVSSYHEEGAGTDGLEYSLDRTNITYNGKEQVAGYYEEEITTNLDGTQTITIIDAEFEYLNVPRQFGDNIDPDPDRILKSTTITATISPDGSKRTETTTTTYDYAGNQQLSGVSGKSEFIGQQAAYWEYTDSEGHFLSRYLNGDDNVTYSYIDPATLEIVIVPEEGVTATLKDGNKYSGISQTQFEIPYGIPMAKQQHSIVSYYGNNISADELLRIEDSTITYNNNLVNNLPRLIGTQEHTEITDPLRDPEGTHKATQDITISYFYDKNGNLDVSNPPQGEGTREGWEYQNTRGWWGEHTSTLNIEYIVILGKALRIKYVEDKYYQGGAE